MACKECRERREKLINAVLEGRLLAAAGHAATGAAEMAGLKPKRPSSTRTRTREKNPT